MLAAIRICAVGHAPQSEYFTASELDDTRVFEGK
jgi:hypothetical protein